MIWDNVIDNPLCIDDNNDVKWKQYTPAWRILNNLDVILLSIV